MAKVIPFRGLRYNPDKFKDLDAVTAPPYDIISPAQQQELYNKDEYNVIRLDYGMDFVSDDDTNNRYTRSAAYLNKWIEDQTLVFEDKPAFYIYEQIFSLGSEDPSHSLKGVIGLVQLEEFSKNIILPHEETISSAKEDRLKLMQATAANLSQVYSLYMDEDKTIAELIESQSDGEPDITFVSSENITQNIWVIKDESVNAELSALFEKKQIFIADGHHRYETALTYRKQRHQEDGTEEGAMSYDYVMMMLVSMSNGGLFVFPTHRMIRGLESFDEVLLIGFLTEEFTVSKIYFTEGDFASIIMDRLANTVDETLFGLYTGQNYYYLLKLKNTHTIDAAIKGKSEAYKHLDVTVLHKLILEKYMGIDEANMRAQKNLVYTRDAHEAVDAVKNGEFDCAFLINPPKVSQIKAVAQANEKMPQKSTYFWPKLVTGIVMNKFED
ncbi:DUF1015 domain-containing protein [Ructibacterium gallinarum]|uniref:DUF1015 domain-containing protein n=1 Tax=Ructibacterium gallinarum TaxID=2779355 RepID=A0A9D5LYR5_9FIRM|nr:DUF1015 domain-containing protein [Ructibacterium gallinarum]MBE5040471.1 DUF1015 domain-containing protein [Ructibacterium gallinarum]